MLINQAIRLGIGLTILFLFAQIQPAQYYRASYVVYAVGILLLIAVLAMGHVSQGAQRWINIGIVRWQPSEIMKLGVPMMLARFFSNQRLPPRLTALCCAVVLLVIPAYLTATQPDLGTAILILLAGGMALLLVGLDLKIISVSLLLLGLCIPLFWHHLHGYQQERILTFLNPERDPLGAGYHIIQSKIAIGSGGFWGKGWLHGTQSHLHFLPAHTTDFIFAVNAEELGLWGNLILISLLLCVTARLWYIAHTAQNTYNRILTGCLTYTFILSALINIGMVVGILPVVGVPLPLVSYGGSSVVTMMASLGIVMSIQKHRQLWGT
jgi:rod shape determining protein RodA